MSVYLTAIITNIFTALVIDFYVISLPTLTGTLPGRVEG
jgi:hypothetical protein